MENIINTFYKGSINKFGFGGWNTTKNNMKEILWSYPYPSNMGKQIDKYFQKSNIKSEDNNKNIHQNYVPSIYSKVLLPKERVDFSGSNAQELKPIYISQYKNFDNHGFINTQTKPVPTENFSPALIRMELLERKMNELEDKARLEMKKSLNEINEQYMDPRFKQFLDKNQGKYDVFGNDPDPLEERRNFVKNNLGNIKKKTENDDYQKYKKRKKFKYKKKRKRRKKLFDDYDDIQEKNEVEEKEEETANAVNLEENKIIDSPLKLIQNINNLPKRNSISGTPIDRKSTLGSPRKSLLKNSLVNTLAKMKNSTLSTMKTYIRGSNLETKRGSIRGSVRQTPSRKSSLRNGGSKSFMKVKEENQIEKVLGDIGYSFEGKTNKEKELQFQTNRIGKDFDKLLHEMKEFQRTIKLKLSVQHSEEKTKINTLKDIFLLDNNAIIKNAVDRAINKIREPFDPVDYKKKVDKEKLDEIKGLIDKKLEDNNDNEDKFGHESKIYGEKKQMMHGNIINKYEYQKYRQKVNNKIITLPNIFIRASKFIISKEDSNKVSMKKSFNSSTQSSENKNIIFNKIKEETIHFGDTVNQDSEFMSKDKSQISQLPQLNQEEEKKENVEKKSENLINDNETKNQDNSKKEDNKSKEKSNSKVKCILQN